MACGRLYFLLQILLSNQPERRIIRITLHYSYYI